MLDKYLSPYTNVAFNVFRVAFGLLFAVHGIQKLFGLLGGQQVELASRYGVAGIIELVGGVLIAAGLLTSLSAFICAGEMAVAYVIAHLPQGIFPWQNNGELALLYMFAFLYIMTRGSDRAPLDS